MGKAIKKAALLLAALCLSSCSGLSVEELLTPPRLDEEQAEIYEALRASTNGDITLRYPRNGQYRSAFVTSDLDADGRDEAIVFYDMINAGEGSSLRMCFLDRRDERWISVYDFAVQGSEVESVRFADLGDGVNSVLVTYLVQNSADKATSVIQYKGDMPSEIFKGRHSYLDVFDLDADGANDLVMITSGRDTDRGALSVYGAYNGAFALRYSVNLSSGLSEYRNAVHGSIGENGGTGIYIDYIFSDGVGGTDVVVYDEGALTLAPAVNKMTVSRRTNSYTPSMQCMDIDGDGRIEIPSTVPFLGYEKTPAAQQVNMTVWYTLTESGRISEKYRTFVGTRGDYILFLPKTWYGRATAQYSVSENSVTFGRYENDETRMKNRLLKIFGAAEVSRYDSEDYIYLGQNRATGYSYYAQLDGGSSISLTEEELKEQFMIFETDGGA